MSNSAFSSYSPLLLCLLLVIICITKSFSVSPNGAEKRRLKVLVHSPTIGWSHMQFMGALADALAEEGHEVHFLKLVVNKRCELLPNVTHRSHRIHEFVPSAVESGQLDINKMGSIHDPFNGDSFYRLLWKSNLWYDFGSICTVLCQEMVQNADMIARLEAEQFDVAISELYDLCPFAFFRRIGVKTQLAALATPLFQVAARRFGIPTFSSYVTNMFSPMKTAPNMNFWERAINFYNDAYEWYHLNDVSVRMQEPIVQSAFGPDFPALNKIARNISLIFVNSNPFFEMPRPISNKVINVGGLVEMKSKPLDQTIAALIEAAPQGAVLISFGSFTETQKMSLHMKRAFLRAFARFPEYTFIWKFDLSEQDAELFSAFKNVHPVKWLDQKSILLHPNLRAFVTHCGQNSLSEAARAGVPVLAIPLFGDQLYNSILAREKRIGIPLQVVQLNGKKAEDLIAHNLGKVLRDPSYRANAQMIKTKFVLSPFQPKETLVRWVEFAAEFPDFNELNLPWEEELSLFAYYSIDVMLSSVAVTAIIIWALLKIVSATLRAILARLSGTHCAQTKKTKMN